MTEFGLIAVAKELAKSLPDNGFEGIGDDCAVLDIGSGESLVFTADLVVEGIHFLSSVEPESVAIKALNVNLSDVASMGVRPIATLLSIALPHEASQNGWAERFIESYAAASKEAGVALIGGDTTASKEHIAINVTAIGRGKSENLKRRSSAQAGDVICVTGRLGGSARGLRELLCGVSDTDAVKRHLMPRARIEQGEWLGTKSGVGAMMDISDGIASDLRHILRNSGVSAIIDLDKIPIAESASLDDALSGGEDYELLLTIRANDFKGINDDFRSHFGCELYPIGKITECSSQPDIEYCRGEKSAEYRLSGFTHF